MAMPLEALQSPSTTKTQFAFPFFLRHLYTMSPSYINNRQLFNHHPLNCYAPYFLGTKIM